MAPGRAPKHPSARGGHARRASTLAVLRADPDLVVPKLPENADGWHPLTLTWWEAIWASPMAPEFVEADQPALVRLARLVEMFWREDVPRRAAALSAEIRLGSQNFGLTPLDRRRLQWEVARGDEAAERTAARRSASPAKRSRRDPRQVLGA